PPDETVYCVLCLRLGERKVVPAASELVGTILDPVRPGDEHLSPPGVRHLLRSVAVDDVSAADGVGAQARADRDHHGDLVARADLDLVPGRQPIAHQLASRSSRWSPTRNEFAIAVSAGLTALIEGKTLVSTT